MRINIALGMTEDWFKYAQVTIASVLLNATDRDEYFFYIMSNKFSEEGKANFRRLSGIFEAQFEFILIDDSYFEGAIHDHLGVSSSYRLRLPSVVNESKMLYLDSDVIVMKNIADLYKIDVSDYYLAAAEDKFGWIMRKRVGLDEGEAFFNGGVQLINLDSYRKNDLENIMMKKLRESSFYSDQDVVNDVCRGKILRLPLRFNIMPLPKAYQTCQEEFHKAIQDPTIIHYITKPWLSSSTPFYIDWLKCKKVVEKMS